MWLERINDFQKNNKQVLDMKFELHLSIYIKELLKDSIDFQIENDSVKISRDEKEISWDNFIYWWQITRFDEIISEEELIFNSFNEKKDKINKAVSKIKNPELNDDDSEKETEKKHKIINDNKKKVTKLTDHLREEANKSNKNINLLKNFRLIYPTIESLERFIKNIKIILCAKQDS